MKKRFIAGAICPHCKKTDTVQMYDENSRRFRTCVACGFVEELRENASQKEIPTRVNQPTPGEKPLAHEEEVQIVQWVTPSKTKH